MKKTKNKKNRRKIYAVAVIVALAFLALVIPAIASAPYERQWGLPVTHDKTDLTIPDIMLIKGNKAGLDHGLIYEMIDILYCESRFDPNAKNNTSTARGLAQFLFKTWDTYCQGDVYDVNDNLDCFIKLYPKHKTWWACYKLI